MAKTTAKAKTTKKVAKAKKETPANKYWFEDVIACHFFFLKILPLHPESDCN